MSSSEPLNTHAGLVNVGMCDGAGRSIPDEIDVAVMAETIRFFVLLNSFDNYGMPTAN